MSVVLILGQSTGTGRGKLIESPQGFRFGWRSTRYSNFLSAWSQPILVPCWDSHTSLLAPLQQDGCSPIIYTTKLPQLVFFFGRQHDEGEKLKLIIWSVFSCPKEEKERKEIEETRGKTLRYWQIHRHPFSNCWAWITCSVTAHWATL